MNKGTLKSIIIDVAVAVAIVLCITIVIKPTIVRGESMDDTLHDGNYLIVNKMAYTSHSPERGDIIVFDSDYKGGELLIKRVIGIGGDEITTDGKVVYVNGDQIIEPYIQEDTQGDGESNTWIVPEGTIFAMGDNRDVSADSRIAAVGFVDEADILGKVAVRLLPFNQIGGVE